jgi:hypothetical protein
MSYQASKIDAALQKIAFSVKAARAGLLSRHTQR